MNVTVVVACCGILLSVLTAIAAMSSSWGKASVAIESLANRVDKVEDKLSVREREVAAMISEIKALTTQLRRLELSLERYDNKIELLTAAVSRAVPQFSTMRNRRGMSTMDGEPENE